MTRIEKGLRRPGPEAPDPQSWRVVTRTERDILGEGLLWSARENALFWTDIIGQKLWRLGLADSRLTQWDMPEKIGWVVERSQGGFIAGLQSGFHRLTLHPFRLEHLADPEPHLPDNRLNDAKADAHGHIWAGTMPVAPGPPTQWPASGGLYRLAPGGDFTQHDTVITIANGPAFNPDGRTLYHTDSARHTVYRFPLDAAGNPGPREVHIACDPAQGAPDGMTCDTEGGLWIGFYGGARVARYTPDGRFDRAIALPTPQITNICFAGANLDRMFVTSAADGLPNDPLAGALFEVTGHGTTGLPSGLYAG